MRADRMTGIAWAGLLAAMFGATTSLSGCATMTARDSVKADMRSASSPLAYACGAEDRQRLSPSPWLSETRPFDADRMDLEAYRQHLRCARRDSAPTIPDVLAVPASAGELHGFEPPKLCGIPTSTSTPGC
jgi:hypothetical protein